MFRNGKSKIVLPSTEFAILATIALVIAVVGSLFFGLLLNISIWYAYTLRCMIFAPLGYLVAKRLYENESTLRKEKIVGDIFVTLVLSLLLLFIFSMVFASPDSGLMTLSCMFPFAIALFVSTNWKENDETSNDSDPAEECPYEVEKPEENEESSEDS